MGYRDLREYLAALEALGLLRTIDERMSKDTEIVPFVRLQFRGLPEEARTAFWFRNVTDARGRSFDGSVVLGSLGASRAIYGAALGVPPAEIPQKWGQVHGRHIPPRIVDRASAPVKEVVLRGPELGEGVDRFPHVISTPGFDPAPFLTAGSWITRDPDTGSYNLGIYRGMIKAPDRIGCQTDVPTQHLALQWEKARRRGEHLEAAVFIGGPPALLLASASKVPYGVDEYGLAGALNGEAIEVVAAETVDCLVPAHAEIVIEGRIRTDVLEPEAPFGEASGYLGPRKLEKFMEVSAITHRRAPIYQGIISEFPPSESTVMRKTALDAIYLRHLRDDCNIPSVTKVACHEMASCNMLFVIALPAGARSALASVAGGGRFRSVAREDLHRRRCGHRSGFDGCRDLGALVQYAAAPRRRDHPGEGPAARPFDHAVGRSAPVRLSGRARRLSDADQCLSGTPLPSGFAPAA